MSPHDITDPVTIASVLVRDHLDTVIQRHGQAPRPGAKGGEVSAAVLRLATALLQHLPGEVKQARVDEAGSSPRGFTPVDEGKAIGSAINRSSKKVIA